MTTSFSQSVIVHHVTQNAYDNRIDSSNQNVRKDGSQYDRFHQPLLYYCVLSHTDHTVLYPIIIGRIWLQPAKYMACYLCQVTSFFLILPPPFFPVLSISVSPPRPLSVSIVVPNRRGFGLELSKE